MSLEYGALAGHAYVHDYWKGLEADRQRMQMEQQQNAYAMAKNKMLGDMFRFGKASNPYDHQRLNQHIEKTVEEMGRFDSDNPGWETDFEKYMQMTKWGQSLENNEWVINAKAFDDQVAMLQDDVAKNPTIAKQNAYQEQVKAMQNYSQFGSITGIESERKPFIYQAVTPWGDLNEPAKEFGGAFKGVTTAVIPESEGGWPGNFEEVIIESELDKVAAQFYQTHQEQFDKQATEAGYTSGYEYAKELTRSYVPRKKAVGDFRLTDEYLRAKAAASGKGGTQAMGNLWEDVKKAKVGVQPPEIWKRVIGESAKPMLLGKDGSWKGDLPGGIPVTYTGVHAKIPDANGVPTRMIEVQFELPYDTAEIYNIVENGIFNFVDNGTDDIAENFRNSAVVIPDTNGKIKEGKKKFVQIKGYVPIDENNPGVANVYHDAVRVSDKMTPSPAQFQAQSSGVMKSININGQEQYTSDGHIFYNGTGPDAVGQPIYLDNGNRLYFNLETNSWEEIEN